MFLLVMVRICFFFNRDLLVTTQTHKIVCTVSDWFVLTIIIINRIIVVSVDTYLNYKLCTVQDHAPPGSLFRVEVFLE